MKKDLINKSKLLETLKKWGNYNPETEYRQGYSRAVKDIIKLIETATPVNTFELFL